MTIGCSQRALLMTLGFSGMKEEEGRRKKKEEEGRRRKKEEGRRRKEKEVGLNLAVVRGWQLVTNG